MKRSSNHLDPATVAAKKPKSSQPALPIRPISEWEVEGKEYIFRYPALGSGWFVVRCERGEKEALLFQTNPFHDNQALNHFNSKCKYHDATRKYTELEMMEAFGRRRTYLPSNYLT